MASARLDVSVVVPSHERPLRLRWLLNALEEQTLPERWELLVVDTGGWLFGRMSVIPAAAVRVVNDESQTVQVDLTKQQIKDAPEFDKSAGYGAYRDRGTEYYGPMM